MFTGIIEATAPILALSGSALRVRRPEAWNDVRLGSSIAVNGCCLTVSSLEADAMGFDLTPETLAKTTFSRKKEGDPVNLERAMSSGGRLDGHVVQGHSEGRGEVVEAAEGILRVRIQKEFEKFVVKKGSIAIDGVSLTVADIQGDVLSFAIIPFTWNHTVMRHYSPGEEVNVETDVLGRYAKGAS